MKKKWTRRKFLEAGLKGSIVVGAGSVRSVAAAKAAPAAEKKSSSVGFDRRQREALRAAMDEIIPAADGMPAASQVGGVEYLERLVRKAPDMRKDLSRSLAAMEEISQRQFGRNFAALSPADRVKVLSSLEKQPPRDLFTSLRDFTYEAYYTQPKVWKLIGYEFYPTNQAGPRMKPFDEAVLAKVRKMPKLYREAG